MNSSSIFAVIALFGWIPLALVLFVFLPARRAVVVSAIAAWSILPPIGIDFAGFPNYTKATAATVGILLGTFLFGTKSTSDLSGALVRHPYAFVVRLSFAIVDFERVGSLRRAIDDVSSTGRLVAPVSGWEGLSH